MQKAKVYFTKAITPESLVKVYEALGRELHGKVAVKISTGEPGGHNFLQPALIAPLVQKLVRSWSATPPMKAAATPARPTGRPSRIMALPRSPPAI